MKKVMKGKKMLKKKDKKSVYVNIHSGKLRETKGITLIALVITIIVLLILAGVAIISLTGEHGILNKANIAKDTWNKGQEEEQIKLAVLNSKISGDGTDFSIDTDELKKQLEKLGINIEDNIELPLKVPGKTGDYRVDTDGNVTEWHDPIEKDKSYVGYYADIDGNGTVDGIIYADLDLGNTKSGKWGIENTKYTIPNYNDSGDIKDIKDYYISKTDYEGDFGKRNVLSPMGTGKDRFYVMALKDIDGNQNGTAYDWYNKAFDNKITDYSTVTLGDFGAGRQNTKTMIDKWNAEIYGEQNTCGTHDDLWGHVQDEYKRGWFVPSKEEWAAFGEELELNEDQYSNYKLSDGYWTSSLGSLGMAWYADFTGGFVFGLYINEYTNVRLSTTF